jgi:hypothetical protein
MQMLQHVARIEKIDRLIWERQTRSYVKHIICASLKISIDINEALEIVGAAANLGFGSLSIRQPIMKTVYGLQYLRTRVKQNIVKVFDVLMDHSLFTALKLIMMIRGGD